MKKALVIVLFVVVFSLFLQVFCKQSVFAEGKIKQKKEYFSYEVKSGDTLSQVSKKLYGSEDFWTSLWNDNDWIENPYDIHAGWNFKTRLYIPKKVEPFSPVVLSKITTNAISQVQPSTNYPQSSFDDIYKAAGAKFGVSWQILYGLHLTESGLRNGPISSGYGTGAQGPMQFMPGTFQSYEVDGDGDGKADINNAKDAIYTAANFLAKHGSLANGLTSYGGDNAGVIAAARSKGY